MILSEISKIENKDKNKKLIKVKSNKLNKSKLFVVLMLAWPVAHWLIFTLL